MVRISALLEKEGDASFEWDGDVIEFRFIVGNHNGAYYTDAKPGGKTSPTQWLADTIVSWNLVDDEDKPIPICFDTFDALWFPIPLGSAFIHAIQRWNIPTESELNRPGSTA